jgi:hypothetical protein
MTLAFVVLAHQSINLPSLIRLQENSIEEHLLLLWKEAA